MNFSYHFALRARIEGFAVYDMRGVIMRTSDTIRGDTFIMPQNGRILFKNIRNCKRLSVAYTQARATPEGRADRKAIASVQCRDGDDYMLDALRISMVFDLHIRVDDWFVISFLGANDHEASLKATVSNLGPSGAQVLFY